MDLFRISKITLLRICFLFLIAGILVEQKTAYAEDNGNTNATITNVVCNLGTNGISFDYDIDLTRWAYYYFEAGRPGHEGHFHGFEISVTVENEEILQESFEDTSYYCLDGNCEGPDPITRTATSAIPGEVNIQVNAYYDFSSGAIYSTNSTTAICTIPPPTCGAPGTDQQCGSAGGCSDDPIAICDIAGGRGCRPPDPGECGTPTSCDTSSVGYCDAWGGCGLGQICKYPCPPGACSPICQPISGSDVCLDPYASCMPVFSACGDSRPPGWPNLPCCLSANGTIPACADYGSGISTCGNPDEQVFLIPPPPQYTGPLIDFGSTLQAVYNILLYGSIGIFAIPLAILNGYKIMTSQGDPQKFNEGKDGLVAVILGTLFAGAALSLLRIAVKGFFNLAI